ncbi:MAG: phosphoribosylamine--glycine ligase [Oscillospiraceae bacterium]|jgi:phosphoribosylamine--glycine ligase|nr:phosphoribosylamine--glycine ligase [Oscillospiraceae bacterium]
MTVLLIGSGGREHAILQAIAKNKAITKIYALPGNGGMADLAVCVPIKATDIDGILAFAAAHAVDFAIPAADDPLCLGVVDALQAIGVPCFGPTKAAAQIEGSKVFAKRLMQKYNIPTAAYAAFEDFEAARAYLREKNTYPIVVKADGLALGKGVVIAQDETEAITTLRSMFLDGKFGASGNRVVIEEFLTGPEVSVLSFCDGKTIVPMVSSMDHKRARDGDTGLNTGGMGTIAPNPYYTTAIAAVCVRDIFLPTVKAMQSEGAPFKGCLYFGLMLTPNGPKVIEYNCRFGDPETQVVLPLLETDLFTIMRAVAEARLDEIDVRWKQGAACCVIAASGGYPERYEVGKPITIGDTGGALLFHAGTKLDGGALTTSGGRVLGVTQVESALSDAIAGAYEAMRHVQFDGMYYRKDIGRKALTADET